MTFLFTCFLKNYFLIYSIVVIFIHKKIAWIFLNI